MAIKNFCRLFRFHSKILSQQVFTTKGKSRSGVISLAPQSWDFIQMRIDFSNNSPLMKIKLLTFDGLPKSVKQIYSRKPHSNIVIVYFVSMCLMTSYDRT